MLHMRNLYPLSRLARAVFFVEAPALNVQNRPLNGAPTGALPLASLKVPQFHEQVRLSVCLWLALLPAYVLAGQAVPALCDEEGEAAPDRETSNAHTAKFRIFADKARRCHVKVCLPESIATQWRNLPVNMSRTILGLPIGAPPFPATSACFLSQTWATG
jgi:hypothetical protein